MSFCASDGELRRHSGYTPNGNPPTPADGIPISDALRVEDTGAAITVFDFSFDSLQRAGTVLLDFRFQDSSATDEWLKMALISAWVLKENMINSTKIKNLTAVLMVHSLQIPFDPSLTTHPLHCYRENENPVKLCPPFAGYQN